MTRDSTTLVRSASRGWSVTTLVSAIVSAFLASACCIGPLILAALGIGGAGAGLLVKLDPYRPVLTAITLTFLAAGFYFTYRKPAAASAEGDACGCPVPRSNRLSKAMLWVATFLVLGFWSFPYLAEHFLG